MCLTEPSMIKVREAPIPCKTTQIELCRATQGGGDSSQIYGLHVVVVQGRESLSPPKYQVVILVEHDCDRGAKHLRDIDRRLGYRKMCQTEPSMIKVREAPVPCKTTQIELCRASQGDGDSSQIYGLHVVRIYTDLTNQRAIQIQVGQLR